LFTAGFAFGSILGSALDSVGYSFIFLTYAFKLLTSVNIVAMQSLYLERAENGLFYNRIIIG
jgi:energy-converting hydrogenase Eha subunit E